jgi:hypothetical protein
MYDKKVISLEQFFGKTDNSLKVLGNDGEGKIKNMNGILLQAANIESRSKDIIARRQDIVIETDPFNIHALHVPTNEVYPFSNWSLGQICDHLGVPVKYVKKCMEENEFGFAAENLNKWLKTGNPDKEFLLRTTGDRLHGFLSAKYGIMDDRNVLEIINDIVGSQGDYVVKNSLLTPELMNIRVVDKNMINIDGEDLSVGLNIKNSRVGQASLEVRLMIFKWICSNGVIFGGGRGALYAKQHRGVFQNDFVTDFAKCLDSIPKIVASIKEWVEKARERKVDSNAIQEMIDKMKKEGTLSIPMAAKVIELIPKYGYTRYGISQAMTEIAQDYSIDAREKIETYAGDIIMAS